MLLRRATPGVVLIAALLPAGCASLGKVLSGTGQPCPDWPGGRWLTEAEPFAENVRRVARDRSDGIGDPLLVKKVDPKYTSLAMQSKIQGEVWLDAVVLADGAVGDIRVARSLDRRYGLDAQAVCAASQWRFQPATLAGQPVPIMVTLILEFKLH